MRYKLTLNWCADVIETMKDPVFYVDGAEQMINTLLFFTLQGYSITVEQESVD